MSRCEGDPDGNSFLLQEITSRPRAGEPGRGDPRLSQALVPELSSAPALARIEARRRLERHDRFRFFAGGSWVEVAGHRVFALTASDGELEFLDFDAAAGAVRRLVPLATGPDDPSPRLVEPRSSASHRP